MAKVFEIYANDLKEEAKEKLTEFLDGHIGNYDIFPLVTICREDEEDEEEE